MHRQLQRVSVLAGVLSIALLFPGVALAQEGSISGVVQDSSGGVLPGVTVEVRSPALIGVRTTVTEGNGRYSILALPVGTYEVRFSLPSFNVARRENIVITTGFTATVNAELRPGDISEEVTVVGEAPTVDVTQARQVTVLTGEDLRDLPTSRNLSSLMVLVPGLDYQTGAFNNTGGVCVGGSGTWCTPNVAGFAAHGGELTQGQLRVDGMVLNAGSGGVLGNLGGYIVDVANAQEVSFSLTGALGESETGGASINIVPRTGGNTYRGSYTTTYTSNRWFDRNTGTRLIGSAGSNILRDHDVSGSFGGPILRDRLWFYAVLRDQGKEARPGGQTFYYNKNAGIWGANYQPDRARGPLSYTNEWRNANVRLTLQATPRNKFNIFWDEQEACQDPCGGAVSSTWSPEANWSVRGYPNRLQQLSWTNPLTNRLLLEGGLSMVMQHYDHTRHKYEPETTAFPAVSEADVASCCVGRDEVAEQVHSGVGSGHPGGFGNGYCFFSGTLCSGSIGQSNLDRNGNARPRLSASYIAGAHNAKVGYEGQFFWQKQSILVNTPQLGINMTTPAATCYDAVNPELSTCGVPHEMFRAADPYNSDRRPVPVSYIINAGNRNFNEHLKTHAIYVQDQWTLNRFTLNGALRYDHATSRYDPTCLGANALIDPAVAWCSPSNIGPSFHDITPRWGVAWDVFGDGKTAIKWNMGKYLSAARFSGVYTDANLGRGSSTSSSARGWNDLNGDRRVDCNYFDPTEQNAALDPLAGDYCAATNATNLANFGRSPVLAFTGTFFCGQERVKREEDGFTSPEYGLQYCDLADQNLYEGWGQRRNEWQFGLGIQRELLPRLSAEVTYNQRWNRNLQVTDQTGIGCDLYNFQHPDAPEGVYTGTTAGCQAALMNFDHPDYSFYSVRAPEDPRLPGGGGYMVHGMNNRATVTNLTNRGSVATQQSYSSGWRGVDTNFVLRARGGLRLNGGTSTGASYSNTCSIMVNAPGGNLEFRDGTDFNCARNTPFRTNVRGSVSYTVPWVDVLASAVFQSRPGPAINANVVYRLTPNVPVPSTAVFSETIQWHENSAWRATNTQTCPQSSAMFTPQIGAGCFMGATTTTQTTENVLNAGDMYGSRYSLVDLKLGKNIRFARRRVNVGVDIYNLFNSDAAVGYNSSYNPQRWTDEFGNEYTMNAWRSVTQVIQPRFARFAVQFDF